jgi:hypothetical protein
MKITIQQNELKAVSYAMAVKDIRYYLCGVLLESNGAETRFVACDGHRLHAVVSFDKDATIVDPVQIILPDSFVKTLLKAKFGKYGKGVFTITIDGDKVSCALPDGTETICKGIDGKFPDYLRVIPKAVSGEYRPCNPLYIIDAHEGVRAYLNNKKANPPDLVYNGDSMAMLAVDRFVAVVMPWRADKGHEMPHEAFMRGMAKPEIKQAAEA